MKRLACLMLIWSNCLTTHLNAQSKTTVIQVSADSMFTTLIPGPQYKRSNWHQKLWGKHYRQEWTTPVTVKNINLDTTYGGLTPLRQGGGRQTHTLHLQNASGKQYVLRSVDKSFGKALPEIFRGTFVERIFNDQVSVAHPYAALTIPPIIDAAGVYHTKPQLVFVPQQSALANFNDEFSNRLYILEERPDSNQSDAENFGYAENVIGTQRLMENLLKENNRVIDQEAFIRARLFDMFIGDWGRHEDQWRWTEFENENPTSYKPVPRDRDQAYTKFDGLLVKALLSAAKLGHLQSFDYKIKDVNRYNFPARHLDRFAANQLPLHDWLRIAKELQTSITDEAIETGIKQLPQEVFPISGQQLIAKLKSRREHLIEYASDYYHILAREVNIVGSQQDETFHFKNEDSGKISVTAYSAGKEKEQPFYHRVFFPNETKEIRIYGLSGNDQYIAEPSLNKNIDVKIIGGTGNDTYQLADQPNRIKVYDNKENTFQSMDGAKLKSSKDSTIHNYDYDDFEYSKRGTIKKISYNREDRLFLAFGYKIRTEKWRRQPFAHEHMATINYSPIQKGFRFLYEGTVNEIVGKWNLDLLADFDQIRWTNYFGVGNETPLLTDDRNFYRLRSRDVYAGFGFNRKWRNHVLFTNLLYQSISFINDEERFFAKDITHPQGQDYSNRQYIGPELRYMTQYVDNPMIPRKGIEAEAGVSYTYNLEHTDRSFTRYDGVVQFYIPLFKPITLAVRAGGSTLTGDPDFFQLNRLGGAFTLRGYIRDRFYGRTTAYNNNELQWIFPMRGKLFNGQIALLGLYDIGRVWMPGENSDTWHTAFGGGLTLSPFNKLAVTVTYSVSKENSLMHFRFRRSFGKR